MEFAFFASNLGYTKADYEALTWVEIEFIKKAWEDRTVRDTHLANAAHHVAVVNAKRRKGKRAVPVLKKREVHSITHETKVKYKDVIERIRKLDDETSSSWIKKIYQGRSL